MTSPSPHTEEPEDLIGLFVRPLHAAGFRYVVAGSVAAMYFSEPRLTVDVDIPILLPPSEIPALCELFSSTDYYCPPSDVLALEAERDCRGHFNVIHVPTGLKADFYPGNRDTTFAWAWQHRDEVHTDAGPVFIAPREYVILWKLIFYREGGSEKHFRDIARMLAVAPAPLDQEFLQAEIRTRGLEAVWRAIQDL